MVVPRTAPATIACIDATIATLERVKAASARTACVVVSRESIRFKPSTGCRRESFGAGSSRTKPLCRIDAVAPPAAPAPITAIASVSSVTSSAPQSRRCTAARIAARKSDATSGATETTQSAAAAKAMFALSSWLRAIFPSRRALAIREGVAEKCLSPASLIGSAAGARTDARLGRRQAESTEP
jgi:hypothetical protein